MIPRETQRDSCQSGKEGHGVKERVCRFVSICAVGDSLERRADGLQDDVAAGEDCDEVGGEYGN